VFLHNYCFSVLFLTFQIRLPHHIHRPSLRLVEYPADILTKDADGEQLDATEKEHDGCKRSEALHWVANYQLLAYVEEQEAEGEEGYHRTHHRGKPQGSSSERGDALNGEVEETPKVPVALASGSVATVEHHFFLLESNPGYFYKLIKLCWQSFASQ